MVTFRILIAFLHFRKVQRARDELSVYAVLFKIQSSKRERHCGRSHGTFPGTSRTFCLWTMRDDFTWQTTWYVSMNSLLFISPIRCFVQDTHSPQSSERERH